MPDTISLRKRKPTFPALSDKAKKRLIKNEKAQRMQTRQMGLPVKPCNPLSLWDLQCGMCWCPDCAGSVPMDPEGTGAEPNAPVIAHAYFRAGGGPGHVPGNTWLWRHVCNAKAAAAENISRGVRNRMSVDLTRKDRTEVSDPTVREGERRRGMGSGFRGWRKFNGEVVRAGPK